MSHPLETKILKNNTNTDYSLPDMGLVVPANGQVTVPLEQWVQFRQSGYAEEGLTDQAISTEINSLTYNDGTDDLNHYISNYYRVVLSQHGVEDRWAMKYYDKRRSQAYTFGDGLSTPSTSYTTLSRFVLRGRLILPQPKRIVAIADQSVSAGNLRLMDVTNNKVLAEAVSFTSAAPGIVVFNISPLADFSLHESLIEVQAKTSGGVLPRVTMYSLELFW